MVLCSILHVFVLLYPGYTVGEEDSEEDMSNDDEASESGDSEDLEKAMGKTCLIE